MEFGITKDQLLRVTVVGSVFAGLLLAGGLAVGYSYRTVQTIEDVLKVAAWALGTAAILPLFVGLGGVLRLRIDGNEIFQMIGPWVVSRQLAHNARRLTFEGRLFPVSLEFSDGSRFRLLAFHLRD